MHSKLHRFFRSDISERAPAPRIFINYRRAETEHAAGRLYDFLERRFGEDAIFMDVDTIEYGADFRKRIEDAIEETDVLIALIGDRWLNTNDKHGLRRLDDPGDSLRIEIEMALAKGVRIIPALIPPAEMPHRDELPPSIEALASLNATELRHSRFRDDVGKLIDALERFEPRKPPGIRIFVSYRRADTFKEATMIWAKLVRRFGGRENVFHDVASIIPGTPWSNAIDEALGSCHVFVVVIGSSWLTATDDDGNTRLEDPGDRTRREIEVALNREILVVPVLIDDAVMPRREQLPGDLKALCDIHATRLNMFAFDAEIAALCSLIERAAASASSRHDRP